MKTSGYKDYRLNPSDDYHKEEIKFLEVFNRNCLTDVDLIVTGVSEGTGFEPNKYLSEDEIKAVLGLVQWLGTKVGINFLRDCGYEKIKEV